MEIIFRIDDFIIARLEKFAHKFQLWTGKNNFWLVRLFWGLFCIFSITGVHYFMVSVLICLVALTNIIFSMQKEKLAMERPEVLNKDKITPFAKWCRVCFVIFTISNEINGLIWIMFLVVGDAIGLILISSHYVLFFTLAVYFEALNPLPPGKNKIKELAKAMAKFFKEIRVAAPAPEAVG